MALYQARLVRDRLQAAHPGLAFDIVPIRTTGDREQHRLLAEIGGKGLFTKEIEAALLDRRFTDAGAGMATDARGRTCLVVMLAAWPRLVAGE